MSPGESDCVMTTGSADAPAPPVESRDVHCRRLLERAAELIAQGDRRQASEQLRGAAARRVETLAAARGWPYRGLADGRVIVHYVADHVGNPWISTLFAVATGACQNIYDDDWEDEDLAFAIEGVGDLIDLLDAAERGLPPDLEPLAAKYYRRRHGLAPAEGE